jgi:superfamily II DNA or RNA helicase
MIPKLYEHQKKIIEENKNRTGLFLGTGGGKTRVALELATGTILVICPKQQRDDKTWQRNATKFNISKKIAVVSKEELRRDWETYERFETVIIDEVHNNLGVLPEVRQRQKKQIPKCSQVFEATLNYLSKTQPDRLYLCSATPVTKPMHLWAIATLFGEKWDFFAFRNKYYIEIRMGGRRIFLPKKGEELKERLAQVTKTFGYTGSLNDFFDVPEQTHKIVIIELSKGQIEAIKDLSMTEADPMVRRTRSRTIENGVLYGKKILAESEKVEKLVDSVTIFSSKKIDYIIERAYEFPKLLVFANYKAQIKEIAEQLRKEGFTVSTLTGETKDRTFIERVDKDPSPHVIIAQSDMSSGYELPSFPCVIYASKSWRYVSYEQSLGRVLRANHLKKNLYIHLVVDGVDKDCHDAIMSGQDFQEKVMHTEDIKKLKN